MWPYLFKWPGLVVLHDAHLHHARAWSLLRRRREADYRAELAFNHPALSPDAAEIGLSGFSGPLYYFWPMLRTVVTSARAVAVHNTRLSADLAAEFPGTPVRAIPMGVADPIAVRRGGTGSPAAPRVRRGRRGVECPRAGSRRKSASSRSFRRWPWRGAINHGVRLLLVGQAMPHFDARAAARALGVDELVTVAGYVETDELPGVPGGQRRRAVAALAQRARDVGLVAARHRRRPRDCRHRPGAAGRSCRRSTRDRGRWSTRSRRLPRANRSRSASTSWTKRTR